VSEADIETIVRVFFEEFGGSIKGVRPGPAKTGGDVFQLDVPDVLVGGLVEGRYPRATFTKDVAIEEEDVDFIALDHPLTQSLIGFCLDSNRVQGQVAVKTTTDKSLAPGILFNYRLGYVSGAGEAVTEKFVPLYVTQEGELVNEPPEFVDTIPPSETSSISGLDRITSRANELHKQAEMAAWDQVESFAKEARAEREREVEIKREHAERYFQEQISEWEERLETYKQRSEEGKDMSAPIGNAERQLKTSAENVTKNFPISKRRNTSRQKSLTSSRRHSWLQTVRMTDGNDCECCRVRGSGRRTRPSDSWH